MAEARPRILLAVTVPISLILMRELPDLLVDDGWDVHIVSAPGPELSRLASQAHVTVHPLRMKRDPSPLSDAGSLVQWIRLLRSVRPHVVSVGTPKASLLGAIASWITRVPRRVYLQRGLRLETATGPLRGVLAATEWLTIRASHSVVAVSPSLRSTLVRLRLGPASKMVVLGSGSSNGVDVGFFTNERNIGSAREIADELGLDPHSPVVGFVGRLAADKGLSELAEARTLLKERGIDHQLLVVGGSDAVAGASHPTTAGAFGSKTFFTGAVANTAPYYQLMDVLCLPTYREGFPNVVLEAAAAAVPTVTTIATGAVDSVKPGVTGLLVPVRSAAGLASALAELLQSPELRRSMGSAAHEWVDAEFRRDRVARLHADFYAEQLPAPLRDELTRPVQQARGSQC